VIQGYLNGKSRDQIAKETGASTGKVSNTIKEWKMGISIPGIDELRAFAITVKKSGISMAQCAEGYRMAHIMKNLGVVDDEGDDEGGDVMGKGKNIGLPTFIDKIYFNCKKLGIPPTIIPLWIKDLLDFYHNSSDSTRSFIDRNDADEYKKQTITTTTILNSAAVPIHQNNTTKALSSLSSMAWNNNSNSCLYENKISYPKPNSYTDCNPKIKTDSLDEIKIPFVSQLSYHIDQKKKECAGLEDYKKNLKEEITKLEIQKSYAINSLCKIKQEEEDVLFYLPWFNDLEEMLWNNYSIKIKEDIQKFSQIINDFKEHGYDYYKIIQEYWKSLSLKLMINTHEADIRKLSEQKVSLNNSILSLESEVSSHTQTMNIYYELEGMRFGLKELKQLWHTIQEIAEANKILHKEAVSKFLKDLEEQYDDKLGFESKVKEKKEELAQLNNKIFKDRFLFRLEHSIGPTLSRLLQKGITEQDIIGINQLVELCTNNNTEYGESISDHNTNQKENSTNNIIGNARKNNSRSEYWKYLIDNLKRYGTIKSAIKYQIGKRDLVTKEIDELNAQKHEMSIQCQNGISFINEINNKMAYFNGFLDHYNKVIDNKIKVSSRFYPMFIFIINTHIGKEKDDT
jgi:hypothetical protein